MSRIIFCTSADMMKTYNSGGEQACKRNLSFLQRIYGTNNVDIVFFSDSQEEMPTQYYAFKRLRRWKAYAAQLMGYKMYFPWNEKKIIKLIKSLNPQIIFFDGVLVGNLLPKLSKNIKKIVFEHNFEKKFYRLKVKYQGLIYLPEYWTISRCEELALKNCDSLICLSERDQKEIKTEYDRKADLILPISFKNLFCAEKLNVCAESKKLLFIGSNFGPNLNGIRWFVKNVMKKLPDYTLYIVGKGFENNREELEEKNVVVVGTVNDLENFYYMYPAIVMPIFYGSGMKVKTAEAMMYGRTIFATDEALEGYDVQNVNGIFRCNTEEEFIKGITSYFAQEPLGFQTEVYKLYAEKYSDAAVFEKLKNYILADEKNE